MRNMSILLFAVFSQYLTCSRTHSECQMETLMPVGARPKMEDTRRIDPAGMEGTNIFAMSDELGEDAMKATAVTAASMPSMLLQMMSSAWYLPVLCRVMMNRPIIMIHAGYGTPPRLTKATDAVTEIKPVVIVRPCNTVVTRKIHRPQPFGPGTL